jgi:hypothetical protein
MAHNYLSTNINEPTSKKSTAEPHNFLPFQGAYAPGISRVAVMTGVCPKESYKMPGCM